MSTPRKHSHYFRDVSHLNEVDVYRVLQLFNVTDQALGHAIKKLLLPGLRGAKAMLGQTMDKDVQEAIDTLQRWQEMRREDAAALPVQTQCACGDVCKGPQRGELCARGFTHTGTVAAA
jgi:hypothetical protein